MRKKYILFVSVIVFASLLLSQEEEFRVIVKTAEGEQVKLYRECHALVVGVSDYLYGWPVLPQAIKQVDEVGDILEKLGFKVERIKNPTKDQLIQALERFTCGPGMFHNNCLVVFFAGHGYTEKLTYGGEIGFIVPQDAVPPERNIPAFFKNAVDIYTLEAYARKMQAKHALFLFDCCFSGNSFNMAQAISTTIRSSTEKPVRQFIIAGNPGETTPEKSIFTAQLIEALKGSADQNSDGYLTGTELGSYLKERVANYSRETQHPQVGLIRDPNLDKGDFVFLLPSLGGEKVTGPIQLKKPETPAKQVVSESLEIPKTEKFQKESVEKKMPVEQKTIILPAAQPIFILKFGDSGAGETQLKSPCQIAVTPTGYIFVADQANHCIQKYTVDGDLIKFWGSPGRDKGQFNSPWGIAVDQEGYVYVSDTENYRVQKFTSDGDYVKEWGAFGETDTQFRDPKGIAVDRKGFVYVVDATNCRVQKFTPQGVLVKAWGSRGSDQGQFLSPHGITVDNSGYVYIADSGNDRIQKFSPEGTFIRTWGTFGSGDNKLNCPEGVTVDNNGYVYVADSINSKIHKYSSDGEFIWRWGARGAKDESIQYPSGIAVDNTGHLYITDTLKQRIQKFKISTETQMVESPEKQVEISPPKTLIPEVKKEDELLLQEKEDTSPVRIENGYKSPKLLNRVDPVYPEVARQARIAGDVVVEATIDIYGKVTEAKVISSPNRLLNQAAVNAVKKWFYEPIIINGRPRTAILKAIVHFVLKNK